MIYVSGSGPLRAKLFFVGEGPGSTEEKYGIPLHPNGMTGGFVRRIVERAGMDPEEVRWNNAIPVKLKPTPGILKKYWDHLQDDLSVVRPISTVACGNAALKRLLDRTGIKEAHGGVYPTTSLGLVVPCLHPAAVMKGKIQAERMSCEKAITRAVRYALGELKYEPKQPAVWEYPTPEAVDCALSAAKVVVVDTEFNPDRRETYCVGLATSEHGVLSLGALTRDMQAVLRKHFARRDLRKVAHYHFADVKALEWLGIDSYPPWFDTMTVFATLYPDLPCGLSHVARFYLDDVSDWKHMAKDDPMYNAIDVINTWRIYQAECEDITDAQMWEVLEEEVFPTLPLLYGMEERGLQVDKAALSKMRLQATREIKQLRTELANSVGELFSKRRAPIEKEIAENERDITGQVLSAENDYVDRCVAHPTYTGLRGKKFTTKTQCKCKVIFFATQERRTSIAALRKQITSAKTKLKRWEHGFDPDNNDHVRWLLYDKAGLGLRVQKDYNTKRPTADATAIAKLLSLKTVQRKAGAVGILRAIKRIQKLEKRKSTFLFMSKAGRKAIDKSGCVHPQYRMRAGTGRPASGSDPYLEEKGVSENKFNVLNIPEEVRLIYVPHA